MLGHSGRCLEVLDLPPSANICIITMDSDSGDDDLDTSDSDEW